MQLPLAGQDGPVQRATLPCPARGSGHKGLFGTGISAAFLGLFGVIVSPLILGGRYTGLEW